MLYPRSSLMRIGILMSKIRRSVSRYPSIGMDCEYVLDAKVPVSAVYYNSRRKHVIALNPGFVAALSPSELAFTINHEKSHAYHEETLAWAYIRARILYNGLSELSSPLTMAILMLEHHFPSKASPSRAPSWCPVYLFTRFLLRQSERRADKTAVSGSLELADGAVQFFNRMSSLQKDVPGFAQPLRFLSQTHPSPPSRLQNILMLEADICIKKGSQAHF